MKKALFLSLILAVGMTSFAQKQQYVKAPKLTVGTANIYNRAQGKEAAAQSFTYSQTTPMTANRYASLDEYETMITNYDLQCNGFVANRMYRFDDGCVGVTETWGVQSPSFPDRGTGYNFYDGNEFGDQPDARVETLKTGWPSYCQYGPNGEIVCAHDGSQIVYFTRENKGEGEWQGPNYIPNPDLGYPAQDMTWCRVVTSGPDHSIIHVIAADQDSDVLADTYLYYCRSTDGVNWNVQVCPTLEGYEITAFSSDYYALAANGNNVAILLTGDIMANTYVIKSEDNGETWTKILIWDNPYAGLDWENDEASLFGDDNVMYGPETGAICIDNNGMVHAAFSTHEYYHAELGTSYNFYSGFSIDGIFYWNESMGQIVDEGWTCPEDGYVIEPNGHNAFRMWWPTTQDGQYITRNFNSTLCGFVDPEATSQWDNGLFYHEDYYSYWQGASALPGICVDEDGTIAVVFSAPDITRFDGNGMYLRAPYMSFIEYPYAIGDAYGEWTEEPGNYYYNEEYLAADFMHMMEECIATSSIQNTTNHEFWISYSGDDLCGYGIGNSATQGAYTDNILWAMKVVPDYQGLGVQEAVNPMTNVNVYPNPVQDQLNIQINASQASEMNIAVYNITGQKVMENNTNVFVGLNERQINVSELTSGIYFVTVKANGFENTMKFIVK